MKITPNELKALQGIASSEYQDGPAEVGKAVWSWSANTFTNKRSFAGAVSSLLKKGLATQSDYGEDATLELTQAGFDALSSSPTKGNKS